jgi:hypothetical protein
MVYHHDLFETDIHLGTLLQAVQKSTMNLLSHDADQLHDFEGLRERCGCLIMVEQKELTRDDITGYHRRDTVSFAHYTVKEYLQSPRISQKKVGFFALTQEIIQKQLAGTVLRQALAIQPGSLDRFDNEKDAEAFDALLDTDFKLYCGVSSVLQLLLWPEAISSDSTLMDLSEALVNPHRPTYQDLCTLLHIADYAADMYSGCDLFEEFQFWKITWKQIPDPNPAAFLSFLVTLGLSDTPHLALAFTKKHSMITCLTQPLHISKSAWILGYNNTDNVYDFVGSIPEMVAQWASDQPHAFNFILDLISEHGATHFDLSTLLLLYISCHHHGDCKKSCSLERLLHLGASANGPEEAFVTPLQISAVCWDLFGIEILLNAGAEPNALGKNGSGWAPSSPMERFNHIHGASSLHIIKHLKCNYSEETKKGFDLDETTRARIETLLLEAGAVDIEPDGSELGFDDVSDESGDSEDRGE